MTAITEERYIHIGEMTMLVDLMQCVLEQCKIMPRPWESMAEHEQTEFLARVELQVADAVRQAVSIITARGHTNIPATIDSVTIKDGVKVVLKAVDARSAAVALAEADGQVVSIIIPDTDAILSDANKPEAEPDQRAMSLGQEYTVQ